MKPIVVNLYLRLVVLFYIIGLFAVPALGADGEPAGGDSMIWFSHPAKHWASEALPIGNGRLGAMLFGGVNQERIQFNEQSLWSGDNNWDGNYDTGDHGFGSYRDFGDVTIDWGTEVRPTAGATQPEATIPSGISPRAGYHDRRPPHHVYGEWRDHHSRSICQPSGSGHGVPIHRQFQGRIHRANSFEIRPGRGDNFRWRAAFVLRHDAEQPEICLHAVRRKRRRQCHRRWRCAGARSLRQH